MISLPSLSIAAQRPQLRAMRWKSGKKVKMTSSRPYPIRSTFHLVTVSTNSCSMTTPFDGPVVPDV